MRKYLFLFSLLFLVSNAIYGQDLSNLKEQKPIQFSGSLNANLNFYSTNREFRARDPFVWTLSGNPTLRLYGITLPFSFVLSQKNQDFRQPFNQFGVSPYYKWLTVHLGFRSLSFSQYTLNGHIFNGVGVEANPGNWRLGGMYGRLLKAVPQDSLNTVPIQPTYSRKGYTVKLGYGSQNSYVDLVLFKGWDDVGSIPRPVDSARVNPQENLALGIKSRLRILRKVTFTLDFALSGWTNNLYAEGSFRDDIPLSGLINNMLTVNYSTQFLLAGKASLSFRIGRVNFKTQYQRIEPDFQTMGSYFFNNDLENITVSPSWSMFRRKLRLALSIGWQRNNLFADKSNQTNRRINSFRLSYSPTNKLNFSSSLTNYSLNQQQINLVKRDVIDSLTLKQFTNNFSISGNYNFGDKIKKYSINLTANQQSYSQDQVNHAMRDNNSKSLSPSFSFRFNNKDKKWGWRAGFNFNNFKSATIQSGRWGLNVSANKKLAEDKFVLNASGSFYSTKLDSEKGGTTMRLNTRLNYTPIEHHSFAIRFSFINRSSSNARVEAFSEFLGNFNYSYTF